METFIIKSATSNEVIQKPHFFVLNKGLNSGKPLLQPCANCFKIEAKNEQIKDHLYWISFALWRSNAFYPYLIGSVIPYIRIGDYKALICKRLELINAHPDEFLKVVTQLKLIEQKEKQLLDNIHLIRELKKAFVFSYFNKPR